jgi:hypothetical protein
MKIHVAVVSFEILASDFSVRVHVRFSLVGLRFYEPEHARLRAKRFGEVAPQPCEGGN